MAAFSRMNEIQRADPSRPEERAAAYRQAIRRNVEATTPEWAQDWTDVEISDGRPSPGVPGRLPALAEQRFSTPC